jgi:hypothetical protein
MRGKGTAQLLAWVKQVTKAYHKAYKIKVKRSTGCWHDGLLFCALVHTYDPSLFDFDALANYPAAFRVEVAFSMAEKNFGVPRLMDVSDIADFPKPDFLSICTYLTMFHRAVQQADLSYSEYVDKSHFGGGKAAPAPLAAPAKAAPSASAAKPAKKASMGGRRIGHVDAGGKEVTLCGWLSKMNRKGKFQDRFFTLLNGVELAYYKTEAKEEEPCKPPVSLMSLTKVNIPSKDPLAPKFAVDKNCFDLIFAGAQKKMVLCELQSDMGSRALGRTLRALATMEGRKALAMQAMGGASKVKAETDEKKALKKTASAYSKLAGRGAAVQSVAISRSRR